MKTRKILQALLMVSLVAVLLLSFAACGKKKKPAPTEATTEPTVMTEATQSTEATTAPTQAPTEETTESTEPTTSATQSTEPTEPVAENYVVRIKEKAKLYRQANTKEALYWLDAGSQYTYIEEMEADGQLWYRVRYSANTTGWIFADRAEKIPAPQE